MKNNLSPTPLAFLGNAMSNSQLRCYLWFFMRVSLFAFAGYVSAQTLIDHAFSFDARRESRDVEVLDYRYGNSGVHGTRADEESLKQGRIAQVANTFGPMPRADMLYVKWRMKKTGEIVEDTVDLRSRLPADMYEHRVHFVIRGRQLYVFLISPEKRTETEPPGPLPMYSDLKVVAIYP
jgi:hypothetical protein